MGATSMKVDFFVYEPEPSFQAFHFPVLFSTTLHLRTVLYIQGFELRIVTGPSSFEWD